MVNRNLFWQCPVLLIHALTLLKYKGFEAILFPDSPSYLYLIEGRADPISILNEIRPVIYPTFLFVINFIFGTLEYVPVIQTILFYWSVLFFTKVVNEIDSSKYLSGAVFIGLVVSQSMFHNFSSILSESLSLSLVIFTFGYTIRWVNFGKFYHLGMMSVLALSTYLTKPSNLIMVLIIPTFCFLANFFESRKIELKKSLSKLGFSFAVILIPLVGYCQLRLSNVGSFSIVSFDGYAWSGISSQLYSENDLSKIPESQRSFAEQISSRMKKLNLVRPTSGDELLYDLAVHQYNQAAWHVAVPAAREISFKSDSRLRQSILNDNLKTFSRNVLMINRSFYRQWVVNNFFKVLNYLISDFYMLASWLFALVALSLLKLSSRQNKLRRKTKFVVLTLCFLGVSLFTLGIFPIMTMVYPDHRYLDYLSFLILPSSLTFLAAQVENFTDGFLEDS